MVATTLDDVFNDATSSSNVIVDADVIEAVKENIQPLQKGRRATALSAIFSTPHLQRDELLSRQRARFRLQMAQALERHEEDHENADLLDVYSRFVTWTLESYPQGQSAESGLLELLEEATRKLKDMECYWQDPRYLKLWTLYASYVDKPATIYAYLLANEIGTNLAQLYEECAHVYERDGRRREADEMYNLGIARKAEPLDHLKKRHADFQRRMIAAPLPNRSSPPRARGPPTSGRRIVLGESASAQSARPIPPSTQDVFSTPQTNARLQIFVDPTGEAGPLSEGNEWPDLGTRVSRTKENTVEISKMGDGPLLRGRPTPRSVNGPGSRTIPFRDPPTRGSFTPFRDADETAAMPPPSMPAPSRRIASTSKLEPIRSEVPATPASSFTPYRDEAVGLTPARVTMTSPPISLVRPKQGAMASEAEALRKNPFKNYDVHAEDVEM